MRRQLVALSMVSALAGCMNEDIAHGNRLPGSDTTPNKWIVTAGDDRACACPNARPFYLVNRGQAPRSINFIERWNDVLGGQGEQLRALPEVHEGWNGRKFLQCSPAHSSRGPDCAIHFSWVVDGTPYNHTRRASFGAPGEVMAKTASAAAASLAHADEAASRMAAGTADVAPEPDCVGLCRQGDSRCLRTTMASGGTDPTADFMKVVDAYRLSGLVPVEELLRVLGQKDNVCERTGLVINGTLLSNTGIPCSWTAGKDTALEVTAIIPGTLSGVMNEAGQSLAVNFVKAELFGPSLHFANPGLDQQFGGAVRSLRKTTFSSGGKERTFVILTGPKNCVALQAN